MNENHGFITCSERGIRPRLAAHVVVARMLRTLFADKKEPVIIAVGGPGGTGKSTFSNDLAEELCDSAVLETDNYRTPRSEREPKGIFGSHPSANRISLLKQHLESIHRGESIDRPYYDHVCGSADSTGIFAPRHFTIIDGEISAYACFSNQVDFTICIDAGWRTQLSARINRDAGQQGTAPEKVLRTFLQSNLIDAPVYSAEAHRRADIRLDCADDFYISITAVSEPLWDTFVTSAGAVINEKDLGGCIVPVLTPFGSNGAVDETAFLGHLDFLVQNGVRRILINGTTAEFFSLTKEERRRLFILARERCRGTVILHAGFPAMADSADEARWAEMHGADAVLVSAPFYLANAPAQGLIGYFSAVARAVTIPCILYNFPKHTQNPVTHGVLSQVPHFGLKDSSGDLSLISATPRYYTGPDRLITAAMAAGGFGFFSAHANVIPEVVCSMETAIVNGLTDKADDLQKTVVDFSAACSGIHHIARLKYALSNRVRNYPAFVRPPCVMVDEAGREMIAKYMLKDNQYR